MVVSFAKRHEGEVFLTLKRRKPFHFDVVDGSIIFFPRSGQPFHPELEKYVAVFNRIGSFDRRDYPRDLWSNSYFTGLIDGMLNKSSHNGPGGGTPPYLLDDIVNTSPTEKQELLKSRVGQGRFRSLVIRLRHNCYVTGISDTRFLRASHIKSWQVSNNRERLDPFNGLLLSPNYDHLFDRGLISFKDDGRILLSPKLPTSIVTVLGIDDKFQGCRFDKRTLEYLKHHRRRFRALANA